MTAYLDLRDLLKIARKVQGVDAPAVRDIGLLEAAAHRPQATAFGQNAYPTLHQKAAALTHSLARNHPLVDGNKRLAWVAARLMYRLNGHELRAYDDVIAAEEFVVSIARGDTDVLHIARVFSERVSASLPRAGENRRKS